MARLRKLKAGERNFISYCERFYFMNNEGFPTVSQAAFALKKSETTIKAYLQDTVIQKALSDRGLPWKTTGARTGELSSEQIATAITIMNFADERSNEEKLDELGVLPQQYYAWLEDPVYQDFVTRRANKNLVNVRPEAITELAKKIRKGDMSAIKFYFEATGEFSSQQELLNVKAVIQKMVESVSRHVKDPAVMAAIAQDMMNAAPGVAGSITVDQPQLEQGKMINMDSLKGG